MDTPSPISYPDAFTAAWLILFVLLIFGTGVIKNIVKWTLTTVYRFFIEDNAAGL